MEPLADDANSWSAWLFVTAVLAAAVALGIYSPPIGVVLVCITVSAGLLEVAERSRIRQLARQRPGEGLCSFVRALDYRRSDTWVVRAVYEQFDQYFRESLPIRPGDRFEDELGIDIEDLSFFVEEIAERCRRSIDVSENNPYYGKVQTVSDLIAFFQYQPKLTIGSSGGREGCR